MRNHLCDPSSDALAWRALLLQRLAEATREARNQYLFENAAGLSCRVRGHAYVVGTRLRPGEAPRRLRAFLARVRGVIAEFERVAPSTPGIEMPQVPRVPAVAADLDIARVLDAFEDACRALAAERPIVLRVTDEGSSELWCAGLVEAVAFPSALTALIARAAARYPVVVALADLATPREDDRYGHCSERTARKRVREIERRIRGTALEPLFVSRSGAGTRLRLPVQVNHVSPEDAR
jgi:hypothetical protein